MASQSRVSASGSGSCGPAACSGPRLLNRRPVTGMAQPDVDLDDRRLRYLATLRRDCIRLGLDASTVAQSDTAALIARRDLELRRLMAEPPGGTRCLDLHE